MVFELLKELDSSNVKRVEEALSELVKKTKTKDEANKLYTADAFPKLFRLLSCEKFCVPALSILANCANVDDKWREAFYKEDGITKLVDILGSVTDPSVINRVARLLANLSKNPFCLNCIQTNFIICSLVKYGSLTENSKCQASCLRALRIICNSKQAAKMAADCDKFPDLLLLMNSTDPDIMLLCLRLICELLKAQTVEIGYRLVEESTLKKLLELSTHSSEDIRDLIMEILFMLSMNSGCRVAVSMEGGIESFMKRIRDYENTKSFKYAVQSLCLCAREAVSRNRMKLCGVLPLMVSVLHREEFEVYHESLVAAFVWFLFDDLSLGLLIRADVTPSLLRYLDCLTAVEYEQRQEFQEGDLQQDVLYSPTTTTTTTATILNEPDTLLSQHLPPQSPPQPQQSPPWLYSTPETSPYHANSPQYSIPSFSPHRSPNYSPPASPQSVDSFSPEYDGYCNSLNESCGSSSKNVPYHFQSADGIHAMIHGTRGPIHDTLLLLSRFSQAKNPSSFFLYLPGFNCLLNYLTLSNKPNPKCARILNRITLNSHCFDILLRKKLIPRLYLRLCTGWSLEHLSHLLNTARNTAQNKKAAFITDGENTSREEPVDNTYRCRRPVSTFTSDIGQLLMSNIRSQCESAYGKGVISNILLAGSKELREVCLVSLPHIIWSVRLQQHLFLKLRAQNMLFDMLSSSLEKDEETFVLIVEAICALCRFVGLNVHRQIGAGMTSVSREDTTVGDYFEPPRKKLKVEDGTSPSTSLSTKENFVTFKFASQNTQQCCKDVLRRHSIVFDKMLSQEFIEAKKLFVSILGVNERAFIVMLHYLCGCRIRLDRYVDCDDRCTLPQVVYAEEMLIKNSEWCPGHNIECDATKERDADKRNEKHPEMNDFMYETRSSKPVLKDSKSEVAIEESPTKCESNKRWKFAFDVLSCCKRFFVDELKTHCEQYLLDEINADNVVDLYMLSTWHGSSLLAKTTLVYLLTMVQCPKLRTEYFTEILQSHEKETFLSQIQTMVVEYFDRKVP